MADFLALELKREFATTRKVLAAVPAAHCGYKPSERCMSALDLATHIAVSEAFFLRGVLAGEFEWKPAEFKTPAEVLAYYDETIPPLIDQVGDISPQNLAKTINFAVWTQPAVAYLNLHLKHAIHHRGQLSAYLRPMGAKVPSIYGSSADEPVQVAHGN
jgi:uncharacterized damage-inducible protein DinB